MKQIIVYAVGIFSLCFFVNPTFTQSSSLQNNVITNIASIVGASKSNLVGKYGKPWKEYTNQSETEFLYYGNIYALFTIGAKSGRVIMASYPMANVDGEHQEEINFSYMGVNRGMTKEKMKNLLGEPSISATRAWIYNGISKKTDHGGKSVFVICFTELGLVEGLEFRWLADN